MSNRKTNRSKDLEETLEVVTRMAPALRAAGVLRLMAGDLHLELEPAPPVPLAAAPGEPARDDRGEVLFLDPSSYRMRDGEDEGES